MAAMFEGFRRSAKRTEAGPVSTDRRTFLRNLAATAAFSAIPVALRANIAEASSLMSPEAIAKRERMVDQLIAIQGAEARSQNVREALEGRGDRLLSRVLRPLQVQVRPEMLIGTKYDTAAERRRYCTQICNRRAENGRMEYWLTSGRPNERPFYSRRQGAYGNGVFFRANDRFLTARHIQDQIEGKTHQMTGRYDLRIFGMSSRALARPEQVLHDNPMISDEHIHGGFVTVEGIDPDESAGPGGYKTYPSIAIKMRRGLLELMYGNTMPGAIDRLANSFMIALPPGEAVGEAAQDRLGTGMSGAPVFLHKDGQKHFAGILHSIAQVPDHENNRMVDVAFFHGIDTVREYALNPTSV